MTTTAAQTSPVTFERFWRWLQDHANCVLRVGTNDATLFDHEDLHWDFFDDDEGLSVVQLVRGKALVGEFLIDRSKVALVQPQVDPENVQSGHWTFEVLGAEASGFIGIYFLMAHGLDAPAGHSELKH
jgi:hypothetical protein